MTLGPRAACRRAAVLLTATVMVGAVPAVAVALPRETVLLRDGLNATAGAGCAVTATHWRSVYDGLIVTVSSQAQIDHIVPLANAWRRARPGGRASGEWGSPTTSPTRN